MDYEANHASVTVIISQTEDGPSVTVETTVGDGVGVRTEHAAEVAMRIWREAVLYHQSLITAAQGEAE